MKIHSVAQNTESWFTLRAGKPTASMFGKIISEKSLLKDEIIDLIFNKTNMLIAKKVSLEGLKIIAREANIDLSPKLVLASTDYAEQLASECIGGYKVDEWLPDLDNVHMTHGHDSELHAIKFYEDETGNKCKQVGFVTDDAETYGCSPDQMVNENGVLEIKAPLAKNIIKYWMEYLETGECPKDFKFQVQGEIMITESDWCDLVLYHPIPRLRKIIHVKPDIIVHKKLKVAISELLNKRDSMVSEMAGF